MCGSVFEFDVFTMGSCGGLSLGWKQDCSIRLRSYSIFHINVDILDKVIGYNWRLSNLYSAPEESARFASWDLLRHLGQYKPLS